MTTLYTYEFFICPSAFCTSEEAQPVLLLCASSMLKKSTLPGLGTQGFRWTVYRYDRCTVHNYGHCTVQVPHPRGTQSMVLLCNSSMIR